MLESFDILTFLPAAQDHHHPHRGRRMRKERDRFSEPIRIPIEYSIDLHSFSPKEIPSLLEEYLRECIKAGIYEVRIIHGKGTGYQRKMVHSFLEKSFLVRSFHLAPPTAGSWGATIALLRRR